ncbi:hypothetical protein DPMN_156216 [Dreissena polymorpha]|uniref:Uncharacterized protein n=1 Tax=Dreissena polymorpha TaxID=45954 RepID=A0A9D4FPD5_DREPO|nr:hypothetical protein DPMN_156216 [Dreissena polymorpha]
MALLGREKGLPSYGQWICPGWVERRGCRLSVMRYGLAGSRGGYSVLQSGYMALLGRANEGLPSGSQWI